MADLRCTDGTSDESASSRGSSDLVFSLAFETYADTLARASFSPDVLLQHLLATPRVQRLVVADPWRSALGLARSLARGRSGTAFPTSGTVRHVAPRRLRRQDSTNDAAVRRSAHRYLARLRAAAQRMELDRPVLLATHPFVAAAADPEHWRHVTYYGWDDWAAHPAFAPWRASYLRAYEQMRERGVRVVGVSDAIVSRIDSPAPSRTIPNGLIEAEWREPVAPPDWFTRLPGPRLLYTGTIDSRLDLDVVRAVAAALPHASLVFAGTHGDETVVRHLSELANVHVQPWQTRQVTRGLVFGCDVALIPHVRSDLTVAMSPLKLYEYLAAGRPVVASALPAIQSVGGVRLANDADAFVAQVCAALDDGPASEQDRLRFVAENSWTSRFDDLLDVAL